MIVNPEAYPQVKQNKNKAQRFKKNKTWQAFFGVLQLSQGIKKNPFCLKFVINTSIYVFYPNKRRNYTYSNYKLCNLTHVFVE
jgi:hypothetical protein